MGYEVNSWRTEDLSVLLLRLETFECLAEGSDSLMARPKKFRIWVSPGNCHSGYSPIQQGEKRAILRGVDLMFLSKGLEILLQNRTDLDIVSCEGISGLSEIVAWPSLNGL